jgi:hypothetical protein
MLPHDMMVELIGRFKNEIGEHPHSLLPFLAGLTVSGLKPRGVDRMDVGRCGRKRIASGPGFQDFKIRQLA